LYYTASGIITPVGSRPMHKLREDQSSLDLCTGQIVLLTVHLSIILATDQLNTQIIFL